MKKEVRVVPVLVSQTLHKDSSIESADVVVLSTTEDEDGYADEDISYDCVNFKGDYKDQHYTAIEVMAEAKAFIDDALTRYYEKKPIKLTKTQANRLRFISRELIGWEEDETEVVLD